MNAGQADWRGSDTPARSASAGRGVVSSLWAVDDRATADLMTALYGQLQQGRSAADALRQAKLRMTFRHNGSDRRLTDVHGAVIRPILA
jgi:hypothetical protein